MLHKAVSEYEIYYNTERPHQNLDNELISPKENEHYEELRLTRERKIRVKPFINWEKTGI